MNAKHTPGPWKRQARNGVNRLRIVDAKGRQVADANHYNERGEENADLLAAAPELLAVARELVRQFGRVSPIGTGGLYELIQDANAAIAKATGGQP